MSENKLDSLSGKKILITGGLGFIGSNLARKCLELGAEVTIFSKSFEKEKNIYDFQGKANFIQGDLVKYEDVEKSVKDQDTIFHLAAQTSHTVSMENPLLDIDINLVGTLNVLEACKKINRSAKIISVGTVSQSGKAKVLPINESVLDEPIEIYSADKLVCEKYFKIYHKVYGLHTTFLRLGTIYGERQQLTNSKRGITNFFIGRIMQSQPITVYGDGEFIREYIYIQDVVSALILSAQKEEASGEAFLVGSENMKFIEMVRKTLSAVEELTGKKGDIKFVPFPENQKSLDVGDTIIDYSKIKNLLGWSPDYTFDEGIRKTIRYYLDRWEDYL